MSMSWLGLIADSDLVCRDAIALQTADSHVHVDVAMYRLEIFWPPVACVDDHLTYHLRSTTVPSLDNQMNH